MGRYFYNFHTKSLAWDLFTRDNNDGTTPTPESVVMITESESHMITEDGNTMITEG